MFRFILPLSVLLATGTLSLPADGPNILPGDFEGGIPTFNPWGGVDDQGNLHVWSGAQKAVGNSGGVSNQAFGPSVAVGDLNGDGLPDLVVADARGFFWYYPNSGKPTAPVFTHGEVLPIWLGGGGSFEGDSVPHINLVNLGDGKLSIVAGNYLGGLYYIHNNGTPSSPDFRMRNRDEVAFPTHSKGVLWCNYLSPFLFDWGGGGRLDLVMGDGTYSANSIYLFTNMGSSDRPIFNEDHEQKIIPGMGREHLTPQVVDWNGDGKPDIIAGSEEQLPTGERVGCIDVWLNQAATKSDPPVFDKDSPSHVMFGTSVKAGDFPTVCPADLNNDGLLDLTVSGTDGRILYSLNTGTVGSPKFGPLVPFKGTANFPTFIKPRTWGLDRYQPDGAPYEQFECVNATIEKGFVPPPDFKGKGAAKFSMAQPNNTFFKDYYVPSDITRAITYPSQVNIEAETRYVFSMWVRQEGNISGLTFRFEGVQGLGDGGGTYVKLEGSSMGGGSTWSRVTQDIRLSNVITDNPTNKKESALVTFRIIFQGEGNLYLDDISLKKAD